jgi:hypothetical protein
VKKFREEEFGGCWDARGRGNKRGLGLSPFNFFTASLSQKGKKRKEFSIESPKALLPLKKGGREGFLARPFQSAKVLRVFVIFQCVPPQTYHSLLPLQSKVSGLRSEVWSLMSMKFLDIRQGPSVFLFKMEQRPAKAFLDGISV